MTNTILKQLQNFYISRANVWAACTGTLIKPWSISALATFATSTSFDLYSVELRGTLRVVAADCSCALETSVTFSSLNARATTTFADAKVMPSLRKEREREKKKSFIVDSSYHMYYQPCQAKRTNPALAMSKQYKNYTPPDKLNSLMTEITMRH